MVQRLPTRVVDKESVANTGATVVRVDSVDGALVRAALANLPDSLVVTGQHWDCWTEPHITRNRGN
jgi:hypothetical protein